MNNIGLWNNGEIFPHGINLPYCSGAFFPKWICVRISSPISLTWEWDNYSECCKVAENGASSLQSARTFFWYFPLPTILKSFQALPAPENSSIQSDSWRGRPGMFWNEIPQFSYDPYLPLVLWNMVTKPPGLKIKVLKEKSRVNGFFPAHWQKGYSYFRTTIFFVATKSPAVSL